MDAGFLGQFIMDEKPCFRTNSFKVLKLLNLFKATKATSGFFEYERYLVIDIFQYNTFNHKGAVIQYAAIIQ